MWEKLGKETFFVLVLSLCDGMMRDGVVEEGEVVLSCGLSSTRVLAEALGCMFSSAHRGEEVMVSSVGEGAGGLRFTAEEFGCLQACALLERDSFSHFSCADEKLSIRVNLNELIDCLNIFGGIWDKSLTALKIEYRGYGNPLELTMQVGRVLCHYLRAAREGASVCFSFHLSPFLGTDLMFFSLPPILTAPGKRCDHKELTGSH